MTTGGGAFSVPTISVITVVKDDCEGFTQTLLSLSQQSTQLFQWVVVDSSSDQSTIPDLLNNSELGADYIWEEPSGIYPAMNQGARMARGAYLYFLNAGDTLIDAETLDSVRSTLDSEEPAWAFGGVRFRNQFDQLLHEPAWDYHNELKHRFARGRFPAHQGVFVQREVFVQLGGFNANFTIAADYHMVMRLSALHDPLDLGLSVANFTQGGASTQSWRLAQSEFRRARREVYAPQLGGLFDEFFYGAKAYASHLVVNLRSKSR